MPTVRDDAVCLRHGDWSETSQTVTLFTRSHGMLRGLAKGAYRDRSPFSGGFELLTRGEIVAITKDTTSLATLTAWDLQDPFRGLRTRLDAFHASALCAEVVLLTVQESDPHPSLYDALVDVLGAIADRRDDDHALLLRFLWQVVVEAGLTPDLTLPNDPGSPSDLCYFDPDTGGFVSEPDAVAAWRVRRRTAEILQATASGERPPADREVCTRAARLLGAYLSFRVGRPLATADAALGGLGI